MMNDIAGLRVRAKRRYAQIERARRDPRFLRVMGRFKAARLLSTNYDVRDHRERITIEDALWAGEFEPRILEILPAAMIKKPSLFVPQPKLPRDLSDAIRQLRRSETPGTFRGIPGPDVGTFAVVATLLVAIAAAASLVPAVRASRVDPLIALRDE